MSALTLNRTLGFLSRNFKRHLIPPPSRCSSSGRIRKRAARFVTGNYSYETGSMTGILGQLKWESLRKKRKDNRLILLYKGLKGKASVPTDDLIPKTRRARNQHSMAFQTPLLIQMFIKVVSSPSLSGFGMPSPILVC